VSTRTTPTRKRRSYRRNDSDSDDETKKEVLRLKSLIRQCGVSTTGITKNMSNSEIRGHLNKIIEGYYDEGMKRRMTQNEIKKFKEKREREKELEDLKKEKRNVNITGRKKLRRAFVSRSVNYNIKFPETGIAELEAFWTDSEELSKEEDHPSDEFEVSE